MNTSANEVQSPPGYDVHIDFRDSDESRIVSKFVTKDAKKAKSTARARSTRFCGLFPPSRCGENPSSFEPPYPHYQQCNCPSYAFRLLEKATATCNDSKSESLSSAAPCFRYNFTPLFEVVGVSKCVRAYFR